MHDRETRVVDVPMEARAEDGGLRRLSGYAALYDVETTIGGLFREVLAPGAFRSAVTRVDDVRALFNHDANHVLGRTTSGTLRLTEDARGLRYEVDLPDTQTARDLWTSVQRGDVSQSSFAFSVDAEEWAEPKAPMPLRVVRDVRLYDVSPVTYPAYNETSVAARSAAEHAIQAATLAAHAADWQAALATRQAELMTANVWRRGR
jgi:HK97 family phage prohead protease